MNTEKLKQWLKEYKVNYSSPAGESIKFILHQVIKKVEELESQHSANVPVSGNEANQSADKKDGEVAVDFAEWISAMGYKQDCIDRWRTKRYKYMKKKYESFTTEGLYEEYKRQKATDR